MVSFHRLPFTFLLSLLTLTATTTLATPNTCTPATPPPAQPKKFGVLLFPGFELLDVAGPLAALSSLARIHMPEYELITISEKKGLVTTNNTFPFHQTWLATNSIYSHAARNLDLLIVPGGTGTRTLDPVYHQYIKDVYPCLRYLLMVCTGSGAVAKTGLLDGKKATSNKFSWKWAVSQGPNVDWVREARWVVDGNMWSTSGVAAGIDGTFAWIKETHGEAEALRVANMIEYERHTDASWDPFSDVWNNTKRGL